MEHTEVKQRRAWTKEEIREVIWCYMYCKQHFNQDGKARLGESLKEKWKNKVMDGYYIRNIDRQLISEEDTFLWLSKGDLKAKLKVK